MKHLYLLIVLLVTCFSIQAKNSYSEFTQESSLMIIDSVVCDIFIDGVAIPNFTPLDTVYDVVIPSSGTLPIVTFGFCNNITLDTAMITHAVGIPGTSTFYLSTSAGAVTYYINWGPAPPSPIATLDSVYTDAGFFCSSGNPMGIAVEGSVMAIELGDTASSLVNLIIVPTDTNATYVVSGSGTVAPYGTIIITVTAEDEVSTEVYEVIIFTYCPLSIGENIQNTVTISPVPASDIINIGFDQLTEGTVRLVDIFGRRLVEKEIIAESEISFDVSSYASGIYFIELMVAGRKVMSEKLVIE